ncbi:MAG: hypothetical protein PHD39_02535 [Methylobacter tundripaludum]|nr:hypothetical protein [Methylobacter tundripaludum]
MNAIGLLFTLVASAFLLALPRRLAAIPLLVGAAYMTRGQILEIGPAHFTVVRILVTVGILRVLLKGERIANGMNQVDRWLVLWAVFLIASSIFHTSDAWVFRIGLMWSEVGCYFLFRVFIQDAEDVEQIFKALCVALVPIAVLMLLEKAIGRNLFAVLLGGINEIPTFRNGHFRAQGPFDHPILAGVVGATCFPMALHLWKSHRKYALVGLFSARGIILASTSSGPIMMLLFILFGLALWKVRDHLRSIRWLALIAVIALDAVMKDPVYFLMARIDISGGSTGWHRSQLIRSSIEHLGEWWLAGTDYTRHWMATGIYANTNHTDITNHLLGIGVMGGLPAMFLFIMVLVAGFGKVGRALRENKNASMEQRLLIWTLGAILFGHVWNFWSISLFDQSVVFFYLILASISAVQVAKPLAVNVEVKQSVDRMRQSRYVSRLG